MIKDAAEAEGRLPEDLVEEWAEKFRGQTINSIRETFKSKQAIKATTEKQVLAPVEATR
jgi:hypothetical protein